MKSGKEIHAFHEPKGFATHLDFHPSGNLIGVSTSDKKVKVYDIRMQRLQQLYTTHEGPVSQVLILHTSYNTYLNVGTD